MDRCDTGLGLKRAALIFSDFLKWYKKKKNWRDEFNSCRYQTAKRSKSLCLSLIPLFPIRFLKVLHLKQWKSSCPNLKSNRTPTRSLHGRRPGDCILGECLFLCHVFLSFYSPDFFLSFWCIWRMSKAEKYRFSRRLQHRPLSSC